MREAVGSSWIFFIVISFTLIFAGFLVMALSYSKTYKLKNELTSIIEKYEGLTQTDTSGNKVSGSINIMNTYLQNSNYIGKGTCYDGTNTMYGFNLDDTMANVAKENEKYSYCVKVMTNTKTCETLFRVTLFYEFNIPVLGDLSKFKVSGQTNEVNNAFINDIQIKCVN
ncbi:MAG: hypothetical protein PUD07_03130 [bacterium]|nr:hypothetical protein [bacterium]